MPRVKKIADVPKEEKINDFSLSNEDVSDVIIENELEEIEDEADGEQKGELPEAEEEKLSEEIEDEADDADEDEEILAETSAQHIYKVIKLLADGYQLNDVKRKLLVSPFGKKLNDTQVMLIKDTKNANMLINLLRDWAINNE